MNNSCLFKSSRIQFGQWTPSIPQFFATSIFVGYNITYLVDVLQFVNNLTDHWLRALHLQLMKVELILHSISRCLLAVSGKVMVKKRFVIKEFKAK